MPGWVEDGLTCERWSEEAHTREACVSRAQPRMGLPEEHGQQESRSRPRAERLRAGKGEEGAEIRRREKGPICQAFIVPMVNLVASS